MLRIRSRIKSKTFSFQDVVQPSHRIRYSLCCSLGSNTVFGILRYVYPRT